MTNQPATPFRRRDYAKITVLGFAITALWQSLHSIILPLRLLDIIPEAQKNTYLGWLTFCGLLLAFAAQPVAGALSDRSGFRWGRRRPFILIGCIAAIVLIPGVGLAGSFAAIFAVYCLLQLASNTAQGPYQAFIPEYVPENRHGAASGVKALMEVVGGVAFVLLVGQYYNESSGLGGLWPVLWALGIVLLAAMLATVFLVKEPAAPAAGRRSPFATLLHVFSKDVWSNSNFRWFLISRLLIYMAFTTIQQFAFYFLRDVIGVVDPSVATSHFVTIAVAGMLLVVWPAGYLSDRVGRKSISAAAGLLGAIGIGIFALTRDYNTILCGALIIGMAMGAFNSANWALATDLVAKGEEARYLGIANMATAGGAALARAIGPAIDFFNGKSPNSGYQFMLLVCVAYFVVGAALVFKIRRRVLAEPG